MSNYGVNAGDGNSIFDIAYKFKQMELREMEKVPTTIRENKLNGSDTGSSDFLTKLQELHSMIFHIDKKSDFTVSNVPLYDTINEDLDKMLKDNDMIQGYAQMFIKAGLNVYYTTNKAGGNVTVTNSTNLDNKFNEEIKNIIDLQDSPEEKNKKLYNLVKGLGLFISEPRNTSNAKKTKVFQSMLKKMDDIIKDLAIKTQTEIAETMGEDTFDKLSKINDSIPNLLKSILKMVNELVSQSNGKSEVWGGEYDDKNKRKLDQSIKEIESEFNALENRPSIKQYIRIYKQIEEPLSILITNVKGMIDNTVTFRGPQQFSLQPLQVITPEKLKSIFDSLGPTDTVNYNDAVPSSLKIEKELRPYVDNDNLIIETALENIKAYLESQVITDEEWVKISNTQRKKDGRLLLKRYAGRDNLFKAIEIIEELKDDVEFRTLNPEDALQEREKEYNEEAKGRFKDQTGEFVGAGKRRDAKQYLDPEYYHFINTMPKKRFL
jgi:hypothetical protein